QRTESSSTKPDPTSARTPKARRSRAQVRKSVPTSEQATASVPVVWIQAGPGKFVRVEGGLQAANSAEGANDSTQAGLGTEMAAEVIEAVPSQAGRPAEPNPPGSVGEIPTEIEEFSPSGNCVSESVTEEYGIAPSALRLGPEVDTEAERAEVSLT